MMIRLLCAIATLAVPGVMHAMDKIQKGRIETESMRVETFTDSVGFTKVVLTKKVSGKEIVHYYDRFGRVATPVAPVHHHSAVGSPAPLISAPSAQAQPKPAPSAQVQQPQAPYRPELLAGYHAGYIWGRKKKN